MIRLDAGSGEPASVIGAKARGLVELLRLGLPVPPGFVIGAGACRARRPRAWSGGETHRVGEEWTTGQELQQRHLGGRTLHEAMVALRPLEQPEA